MTRLAAANASQPTRLSFVLRAMDPMPKAMCCAAPVAHQAADLPHRLSDLAWAQASNGKSLPPTAAVKSL
jgi:hypothetical protein